jgi:hypothetical protein
MGSVDDISSSVWLVACLVQEKKSGNGAGKDKYVKPLGIIKIQIQICTIIKSSVQEICEGFIESGHSGQRP